MFLHVQMAGVSPLPPFGSAHVLTPIFKIFKIPLIIQIKILRYRGKTVFYIKMKGIFIRSSIFVNISISFKDFF